MNKKLQQILKGHKVLVFMDYEGTQFSHEMIAIGAILVVIDPKTGRIKKKKSPFKTPAGHGGARGRRSRTARIRRRQRYPSRRPRAPRTPSAVSR